MDIKIERNVPIPPRRLGLSEVFGKLKVGDSCLFTEHLSSIRQSMYMYGRRYNKKFAQRTVPEGVRVWRIK